MYKTCVHNLNDLSFKVLDISTLDIQSQIDWVIDPDRKYIYCIWSETRPYSTSKRL